MAIAISTAEAAAQADVTVATIRTWCRNGVVAAVKQAGRWIVETASLAYRIALPAQLRPAARPVVLTVEGMVALGGREWKKNGHHRVYFNADVWAPLAGLHISYYGTGNVSGAALGGEAIANGRAHKILATVDKVWFDAVTGGVAVSHWNADAIEVRYLAGGRDTIDLVQLIQAGIRTAATAR